MGARSAGRRIALASGLAAAAVVAALGASWRPIAERWHLAALREDPGQLLIYAQAADGDPKLGAAHAFLKERAGAEALVAGFVQRIDLERQGWWETSTTVLERRPPGKLNTIQDASLGLLAEQYVELEWEWGWGLFHSREILRGHDPATLLAEISGRELELSGYPGLKFLVLPLDEALARYEKLRRRFSVHDEYRPLTGSHACLVYRSAE